MIKLDQKIIDLYKKLQFEIKNKLQEFKNVPEEQYFYELVYCLCTPMSKAENALKVQKILMQGDLYNNEMNISSILRNPDNYIRFHNNKAKFIEFNKQNFLNILEIIKNNNKNIEKRKDLIKIVKGFGYKEASHFLRNIGYFGLAILARHIIKHLQQVGLIEKDIKINCVKTYIEVEETFINYASKLNLQVEELDLLLWANETGQILK